MARNPKYIKSLSVNELTSLAENSTPTRRIYGLAPKCHPERKHQGRGLCQACYTIWRRSRPDYDNSKQRAASKRWAKDNHERSLENRRRWWAKDNNGQRVQYRHKYGITLEQVNQIGARQEGRCAICVSPLRKPCVDHNHNTGQIRGLLCVKCNAGLGSFDENPKSMQNAITYITYWRKVHSN